MDTPDQILNAALTTFYENGFHATGVDQLSAVAGVTKRTLYRHFPSKESLIDEVLQLRDRQFMQDMQGFVEAMPVAERPLAYLDFLLAWSKGAAFHGCMFINATAEYAGHQAPPHVQARLHKEKVLAYLERICCAAGCRDARTIAAQLFVTGEGLIVLAQVLGQVDVLYEASRQALAEKLRADGVV